MDDDIALGICFCKCEDCITALAQKSPPDKHCPHCYEFQILQEAEYRYLVEHNND